MSFEEEVLEFEFFGVKMGGRVGANVVLDEVCGLVVG